ncbi:hypothetical protein P43SY_010142 [Pythium insidiosum]|uniref:Dynein axonemal intermediate chain 4 n=1 Tax=Pythium insidiosum TaxID=114742 RepID=A0AAD5LYZ4_PYTIN|nr:hypothetical protein P43SY_010142 [Pythium insidiosum]
MSSPSSARVQASSSRIRSSKRDINPGASRSRAFGASAVSNSSRQVAGTGGSSAGRSAARVYLDGVDVTPQSLLLSRIKPSTSHEQRTHQRGKGKGVRGSKANGGGSVIGASVILSQDHLSTSSIEDTGDNDSGTSSANVHGANPRGRDTRPVPAKPTPAPTAPPPVAAPAPPSNNQRAAADEEDAVGGPDVDGLDIVSKPSLGEPAGLGTSSHALGDATQAAVRTERKHRRPITIQLMETPTEMLFELRSLCVAQDATYHQAVAVRNKQYVEMCAAKKGSDKFVEGRSQTLQLAQKTKEVMTAPPATRDSACMATDWDIFDCARIDDDSANDHDDAGAMDTADKGREKAPGGDGENGEAVLKQQVVEIVDATMASAGCVLDVDGDIVEDLKARQNALRHARKGKHGAHSSVMSNSQKSRLFHHSSTTQSSADLGRSTANVLGGNTSSSSMTSPSQSTNNVSFGASQDVSAALGSGEDSNNSVQNSQVGVSGASQVFSGGHDSGDGKMSNAYARASTNVDLGEIIAQQRTAKVLKSSSLHKTASIVERAVQQNVFHQQHVLYRNFPSLAVPSSADGGGDSAAGRKEKRLVGADHDWRSSLGLGSDTAGVGSGSVASSTSPIVPPIASLGSTASTGAGGRPGAGGVAVASRFALEKLWAFKCQLTEGRRVTCLAWNTVNEDLLAVSYAREDSRPECPSPAISRAAGAAADGATSPSPALNATSNDAFTAHDDGLVLFWSLKNPEYPERIYNLDVGVTCVDFSHTQPYLLAVGFANGVVAIFDTRRDDSQTSDADASGAAANVGKTALGSSSRPPSAAGAGSGASETPRRHVPIPIATSETSHGKHLDAVWQVKWISKGSDRGENVVSISSDGRVTEWSMKKGLSFSDLMTLKRVANPLLGSDSRADGVISRQASGHCIDFAKTDPSVYYVGTEDGIIHKCSVSYNEQYLQTYYGHTGPVYQLLVSPFSSDLFLSCSADWNVKLWHQNDSKELLNFRSINLQHAVHGISWCPSNSTIFGLVTEDGRVEIWDLHHSSLDPIITHMPKKFAPALPVTTPAANAATASASTDAANNNNNPAFDPLDDVPPTRDGATTAPAQSSLPPREIRLECTRIGFAPSAPVIVVGDSTGDVTVYRVPVLADTPSNDAVGVEDPVTRLLRAAFQDLDPHNSGYIVSKSEIIDTLCDAIPDKYQRRIDFDTLLSAFQQRHRGFDYTAVDKRLEVQRLLTQSIRRKLLHGVVGADYNGFLGLQETLFRLDESGNGTLGEDVFKEKVLKRLKKPLTRQEIEFLNTNIRVGSSTTSNGDRVIDYEQIGTFCNLDSDASADETERAEQFLELAEEMDRAKTGYLPEADYHTILSKCKVQLAPATLRSMLARFSRTGDGKIPYLKFLEQYGQNPTTARERRRFKRVLQTLVVKAGKRVEEWMAHLARRWEKLDMRSNQPYQRKTGRLPSEAFLRVLQRKDGVMPLTMDEATQALDLFLRVHPANVAEYLIHHATETERQHFESLMDALHRLHQRVQRSASQSTPPASTPSSGGHEAIKNQDQETAVAIGELTAIENGICLPLGPRLQVRDRRRPMVNQRKKSTCQLRLEARSLAYQQKQQQQADSSGQHERIARASEIRGRQERQRRALASARVQHALRVAAETRARRREELLHSRVAVREKVEVARQRRQEALARQQEVCKRRVALVLEKVETVKATQHCRAQRQRRQLEDQLVDAARRREEQTQKMVRRLSERWQCVETVKDRVQRIKYIQRWYRRHVEARKAAFNVQTVKAQAARLMMCWERIASSSFEESMRLLQDRDLARAAQHVLRVLLPSAVETGNQSPSKEAANSSPRANKSAPFRVLLMVGMVAAHPNEIMEANRSERLVFASKGVLKDMDRIVHCLKDEYPNARALKTIVSQLEARFQFYFESFSLWKDSDAERLAQEMLRGYMDIYRTKLHYAAQDVNHAGDGMHQLLEQTEKQLAQLRAALAQVIGREDAVTRGDDQVQPIQLLVDFLAFALEKVEEIRGDAMNAHLGMLAAYLSHHGVDYEQKKLASKLQSGITMPMTEKWLVTEVQAIWSQLDHDARVRLRAGDAEQSELEIHPSLAPFRQELQGVASAMLKLFKHNEVVYATVYNRIVQQLVASL